MKKVKFTFWLLGFGCGMILTGMLGTLLTLKVDFEVVSHQEDQNLSRTQSITKEQEEVTPFIPQKDEEVSEIKADEEENFIKEEKENISNIEESVVDTQEKYEVYIPSQSGASEICAILEQAGIVEDGKDFLNYIKEQEKQTKLNNGYFELPNNADYATLLALLAV